MPIPCSPLAQIEVQGVHQLIDGAQAVLFGSLREVGIAGGGRRAGMAEQGLDVPQAQAAFQQMSGKTVPKRVNRDFFLMLQAETTAFMACWVPPAFIWLVAC